MKSIQEYRGNCWRILAKTTSSAFAWDVIRLRFFAAEQEVRGEAIASGNAIVNGSPEYFRPGHTREEGPACWGGRADENGDFWIGIRAENRFSARGIYLEQGPGHWVSSLSVQVLSNGHWVAVQEVDGLSPGVNQIVVSQPSGDGVDFRPAHKYSMIILNYRRRDNVIQILDTMADYQCLDEIVVSNALQETAISYDHPKVVVKDDYVFDKYYGIDRRFLNGLYCKHPNIILLDDDNLVSEQDLLRLIAEYEKDPNRMVSAMGRNNYWVRGKLVYKAFPFFHEVDYALSPVILQRAVCQVFFYCKPLIEDLYRQGTPYGNVDDLYSSFVAGIYYQRKHYCIPDIEIVTLPQGSVAISGQPGHFSFRTKIINFFMDNREVFEHVIGNFRESVD